MVIWHGVLTLKPGKREEYVSRIMEADLLNKFLNEHHGVHFYNIAADVCDPDKLVVMDCWETEEDFKAHDTSKEADKWREIYADYVIDCKSELYTCSYM